MSEKIMIGWTHIFPDGAQRDVTLSVFDDKMVLQDALASATYHQGGLVFGYDYDDLIQSIQQNLELEGQPGETVATILCRLGEPILQHFLAKYTIRSSSDTSFRRDGQVFVRALNRKAARSTVCEWAHENDPYCDRRIDPNVFVRLRHINGDSQFDGKDENVLPVPDLRRIRRLPHDNVQRDDGPTVRP